jgi:hypothetical protein
LAGKEQPSKDHYEKYKTTGWYTPSSFSNFQRTSFGILLVFSRSVLNSQNTLVYYLTNQLNSLPMKRMIIKYSNSTMIYDFKPPNKKIEFCVIRYLNRERGESFYYLIK